MMVRIGCVLACTLAGAVWILTSGPMLVVRGMTPLPDLVPFWYQISAFPILGLLLADLIDVLRTHRFSRPSLDLALQLALVVLLSSLRLDVRLPLSGHALLVAYFLSRRLLFPGPATPLLRYEMALAILVLALVAYIKLIWWSDPLTLTAGLITGTAIAAAGKWLEAQPAPERT